MPKILAGPGNEINSAVWGKTRCFARDEKRSARRSIGCRKGIAPLIAETNFQNLNSPILRSTAAVYLAIRSPV